MHIQSCSVLHISLSGMIEYEEFLSLQNYLHISPDSWQAIGVLTSQRQRWRSLAKVLRRVLCRVLWVLFRLRWRSLAKVAEYCPDCGGEVWQRCCAGCCAILCSNQSQISMLCKSKWLWHKRQRWPNCPSLSPGIQDNMLCKLIPMIVSGHLPLAYKMTSSEETLQGFTECKNRCVQISGKHQFGTAKLSTKCLLGFLWSCIMQKKVVTTNCLHVCTTLTICKKL